MGRHVIGAFERVNIRKIFRCDRVDGRFQIDADVGVGILVNGQRGRGVLNEDVREPNSKTSQLGTGIDDATRDQVKSTWKWTDGNLLLHPRHERRDPLLVSSQILSLA